MTDTTEPPVPLLKQARDAMRGLPEVEHALAAVAERLRAARATPKPELDDATAHVQARVLAGEPVPDDLSARVLTQRRTNEAAQVECQVLGAVERHLKERLWWVHKDRADDGLRVLRDELAALLAEARPVLAALGDVATAGEAIDAERVTEWRHAGRLAERYAELRAAQCVITSGSATPTDNRVSSVASREARQLVADFGTVLDPARHHPELGTLDAGRDDAAVTGTRVVGGRVVTSSHVDRTATTRPWTTGDPLTDLRFITREDAEPWLPTVAELTRARDEHQARRRAEAREAAGAPADEQSPGSLIHRSGRDPRADRIIRH